MVFVEGAGEAPIAAVAPTTTSNADPVTTPARIALDGLPARGPARGTPPRRGRSRRSRRSCRSTRSSAAPRSCRSELDPCPDRGPGFFSRLRADDRSVGELLRVDLGRRDTQRPKRPFDVLHERDGPAQVDIPVADVGTKRSSAAGSSGSPPGSPRARLGTGSARHAGAPASQARPETRRPRRRARDTGGSHRHASRGGPPAGPAAG